MNLRKQIIENAGSFVLQEYIGAMKGDTNFQSSSAEARKEVWSVIKDIILQADDAVQVAGLSDGPISNRVDSVMQAVASGQLTIQQGKRLIEMLQAGFEITELQELIGKLTEAGVDLD